MIRFVSQIFLFAYHLDNERNIIIINSGIIVEIIGIILDELFLFMSMDNSPKIRARISSGKPIDVRRSAPPRLLKKNENAKNSKKVRTLNRRDIRATTIPIN